MRVVVRRGSGGESLGRTLATSVSILPFAGTGSFLTVMAGVEAWDLGGTTSV
jgi:hypothetical protein